MSKFSEDIIKLFEKFKKETGKYQDLNLEEIEFDYYYLKDLFEAKGGSSKYTKKYIKGHQGEYPLLTGKLDNESIEAYIDTYDFEGECITYNKDNAGGSRVFYRPKGFKFSMNSHHVALFKKENLPNNINDLDYKYSMYALNRLFEIKKYGWELSANWNRINEEEVPIPKSIKNYTSYDIQKAIAEFIEHVFLKSENIVSLMEDIIKNAEKGKKHLLYKLFDKLPSGDITEDVIRLFEEFKEEIGKYQDLNLEEIEFEEKKLIDFGDGEGICEQRMGFTPKTTRNGDIYFYKVGDLSNVQDIEITNPQTEEKTTMKYVDETIGKNSKKRKPIQKGEILVSFKLTIGVTKIYNSDEIAYCNEAIDILTPKEGYYNKYLAFIVGKKYQEQANAKTVKGKSLNEELKKKIYVPIPKSIKNYTSYDIQKAIAEFIEYVYKKFDNLILKAEENIEKTKILQKCLLIKVFQ